ncbi:MAG: hypothetical protein ACJ8AW_54550, partial [Rhodopila sp.]
MKPNLAELSKLTEPNGARVDVTEIIGRMILPGCLLILFLPLGGAALGHWLDRTEGSLWGFAIGFVLGFALA